MKREDLIKKIREEAKITKDQATVALNSVLDGVTEALQAGGTISFVGFGTFSVSQRKERKGINLQTKEPIVIPACKVPVFRAGKRLKESVK